MHSDLGTLWVLGIIVAIVWQVIKTAAKESGTSSTFASQSDASFSQSPVTPRPPSQDSGPINWTLVKENLDPDEIQDCFDVDAISGGIPLEDLPKYVRIDRLRKYFTDQQLSNIIDLNFFLKRPPEARQLSPTGTPYGSAPAGTPTDLPPTVTLKALPRSGTPTNPPTVTGQGTVLQQGAIHQEAQRAEDKVPSVSSPSASDALPAFQDAQGVVQGLLCWQVMTSCPGMRYYSLTLRSRQL